MTEGEQALGLDLRLCEFAGERQTHGQRGRAVAGLGQSLADRLARAPGVVEARACAAGSHRAGLVVDVLLERRNRGLSLAGARIQTAPGLVQVKGALKAGWLVFREGQR